MATFCPFSALLSIASCVSHPRWLSRVGFPELLWRRLCLGDTELRVISFHGASVSSTRMGSSRDCLERASCELLPTRMCKRYYDDLCTGYSLRWYLSENVPSSPLPLTPISIFLIFLVFPFFDILPFCSIFTLSLYIYIFIYFPPQFSGGFLSFWELG